MKTMKLIFSAIMMMVAMCAQAQTIQVMKDGKVVKEYPASEVKSVEVKQVYYYYAGWECPRNEEELANMATGLNGGYESSIDAINHDWSKSGNGIMDGDDWKFYVVIPQNILIWDTLGNNITTTAFNKKENVGNYNVYESKGTFDWINAMIIHK